MKAMVFVGVKASSFIEEDQGFKRIKHEGKEYIGLIAEKPFISIKDIEEMANKFNYQSHDVTLIPLLLFG